MHSVSEQEERGDFVVIFAIDAAVFAPYRKPGVSPKLTATHHQKDVTQE
jgi:hypothetical protein